jgi:beta-lactamase superfamily II metal-dependent hydrolase
MATKTTVEIRMYHVGFGDAFRVTVKRGDDIWRMLVDCGVHGSSVGADIAQSVKDIIGDLKKDSPDGTARLDVVIATHHHQDHVVGFAEDDWATVQVDEVWLPYVENPKDPDTKKLGSHGFAAAKLEAMIDARRSKPGLDADATAMLNMAAAFAANSNAAKEQIKKAMDRLGSRSGRHFATPLKPRFLPDKDQDKNTIDIGRLGIVAHILGPSRDPAMIRKMYVPKKVRWLNLDEIDDVRANDDRPLFHPKYIVDKGSVSKEFVGAKNSMRLGNLTDEIGGLLAAASLLESATNNTSLFFVLQVGELRFLFPGDAQQGAWEHVRKNPEAMALIENVDFYKVGHHGSHNATPKPFVLEEWLTSGDAMVPWGSVPQWDDTIPKEELMTALTEEEHRVILPGDVRPGAGKAKLKEEPNWTQLTFAVP